MLKNKMPKRSRTRSRSRTRAAGTLVAAARRAIGSAGRRKPRLRAIGANTLYHYTRYMPAANISLTSDGIPLDLAWQLNNLNGYTDFTTLYDQYKITKVVLKIMLTNNPDGGTQINTTTVTGTNWYPKLWYIPDYDSGSSETLNSIRERQGVKCKILRPNSTFTIVIRPKVLVQTYRTAVTTGYGPKSMFLDITAPDVPHYGLKGVWDLQNIVPAVAPFRVNIEQKFYFTCKNVR